MRPLSLSLTQSTFATRADLPARLQMRIRSTYPVLAVLPCLYVVYGWLVYYEVHVAGPVIVLFFLGAGEHVSPSPPFANFELTLTGPTTAAIMVIYSSTLAYIVDANPGRSTSTMACNSLFRGLLAVRSLRLSPSRRVDADEGWE